MSETFTNLDAQWLADLVSGKIPNALQPDLHARVLLIAQHLQSMDEKLVNLEGLNGPSAFAKGVQEGQRRIFARANVMPDSREMSDELYFAIKNAQVTKISRAPSKRKVGIPSKMAVEGVTLDLSKLGIL